MIQLSNARFLSRDLAIASDAQPAYAIIALGSDSANGDSQKNNAGHDDYAKQLGKGFSQKGCQIDIFRLKENSTQPEIVNHALGYRTIYLSAGPRELIDKTDLFSYLPEFVESWIKFQKKSGRQYTLLHSNNWLSGWVSLQIKRRLGTTHIHRYSSFIPNKSQLEEEISLEFPVRLAIEEEILEQADCVITDSLKEKNKIRQLVSKQGRVKIIPEGIDTEYFASMGQAKARQILGISSDLPMFLYVGSPWQPKVVETILRACQVIPKSFRLYLLGDSRQEIINSQKQKSITDLISQLGLEKLTVFNPDVPLEHLPIYYAAASACLMPNPNSVALEAMAAGAPVIGGNVGEMRYVVSSGKTGMLVTPRQPLALSVALENVLEKPLGWRSYGYTARKWVRDRCSHFYVAEQIHQLYQAVIDSSTQEC